MIAWLHIGYVRTNFFDHTRRFMTKHNRQPVGIKPFYEMKVAMTDTRSRSAHQNFAWTRLIDGNVFDNEGLADFV